MRVAHIATSDLSLRFLLLNQLESFRAAGYEVVGVSAPGEEVSKLEASGVRHVAVEMTRGSKTPLGDLIALAKLALLLRREKVDIVHTHTPKAGLLGQYAALLAGVPIRVHTIHGLYFPGFMKPHQRWAYVLLERLTMAFSQCNLSQNPEDIPVAVREHICRADRIELLGNGIDVARFEPSRPELQTRQAIRAEVGIPRDALVVGMVGRLVAEKGYVEMFEAAAILCKNHPNVHFVFIGGLEPDKFDAVGPADLGRHGITEVAHLLGHRRDVDRLYPIMDVFTLPSHREGFPRAPMEASAMGLPCVVTDVRGCRQTVDDGVTGFIVPAREPKALASALEKLLADGELRAKMGRAAREKALREFDERVVIRRILRAYARLLAEHGMAPAGRDDGQELTP